MTEVWAPGQSEPPAGDLEALRNVRTATRLAGMPLFVTVMSFGSATTPLTDADRASFAAFAASVARTVGPRYLIVGNEPNINRFWLPQFNPDGTDAAATSYELLLAQTYDAVKAAAPATQVLGGALSPRGSDNPAGSRPTHSPTVFLRDLGAAYRATGRATPLMDGFVMHPYEENSSVEPVKGVHPRTTTISIADYDKLVQLLGEAFDGTAQRGSTLPIHYGEFGVETTIPAARASGYTGNEPSTVHPVDPVTQGRYYRQAVQLAFCQPNVRTLLLFHVLDEPGLPQWQSGVYYVDGTPKPGLSAVRAAIAEARRGVVAACPGLRLTPRAKVTFGPGPRLAVTCDIDCVVAARAGRRTVHARAVGGVRKRLRFRALAPGSYRARIVLAAPVNPGPPRRIVGTVRIGSG